VTDFGFTARLGKGKNRLQTECGTLEFAAPEIWDFHQAGTAADIWSLGATLFFLKYGSPFVGDSRDIAKASRHLIVSRSSKLPKSFDGLMDYYTKRALGKKASPTDLCEVDLFILTLLQYDPRARPSAGDALREWEVIERRQQNV
jgi:serine/threonine protein kinase